ncbi:hypothetical protein NHP190003_09860 [Helicobacter sp. NHP19-003]|uniref:Poly E-rich protein n=1 Tax=Helicobacter gastrocanis TaxID=2849641 RepID=A0ABM7SIZ8_9HELI|nr:hypothetical protein [Helicobacter sp. NHP19-003]BCZ17704.1 hypothetical protein NHP190003_09860 [Helicobacter sp. NHP19-003]
MKILLVNQNKMVGKLFENIAKKLDIELVAEEHVDEILPALKENPDCFFFADDTAVDNEEYGHLKPYLGAVQLSGLLLRKGIEEFGGFTHYIKKPFLPTDILHILQRSMGTSAPTDAVKSTQQMDVAAFAPDEDFFKDIDSSLSQLEGLLDPKTSQEPSKQESKEEPQATPQEAAPTESAPKTQSTTEEPPKAEPSTATETPKESTPQQKTHDPLALNLDDLLPVDDSEDETHAGLEHDEMLEDLVQKDSPKAQELMDSVQDVGTLMQSAEQEIDEAKKPDLQTPEEPQAPKESDLNQDPMGMLEELEALGLDSNKSTESEPEPAEQEPQTQESTQTPELEDLDNLGLESTTTESQPESTGTELTETQNTISKSARENSIEQEPQTTENAQEGLEQSELEDLEGLGDLGLESTEVKAKPVAQETPQETAPIEQELTEPTELEVPAQESQIQIPTEQTPQAQEEVQAHEPETKSQVQESLEQPALEDTENLENLELESTQAAEKPQDDLESKLEPQESHKETLEPESQEAQTQLQEQTPPTTQPQEDMVELEKDPQEYEHIEDIPAPVMSSVVDGSYEAPQASSQKETPQQAKESPQAQAEQEATEPEPELESLELENLAPTEVENPEVAITKDPKAPKEPEQEALEQIQEAPQESAPTTSPQAKPLHLNLDLRDLLQDLSIDPKLLEGKTLQIQVNLVDKDV